MKEEAMARILYIEDIQDNITLVERIVASRGHELISANNAEKGLQMAFDVHPDLILLDLGLPDADGQTLSVWLRNDPTLESVPIIVLTAWPEEVARHTVEGDNPDGYLLEPINLAQWALPVVSGLNEKSS